MESKKHTSHPKYNIMKLIVFIVYYFAFLVLVLATKQFLISTLALLEPL